MANTSLIIACSDPFLQGTTAEATEQVKALSIDGGNVRLRTALGEESIWRNYKAVKLHGQVAAAFFQNNADLVAWVNSQLKSEAITCLGDGHDGVWNLFNQIGTIEQRREVLDWYQGNRKFT
ncbi:hypothetical protein [Microcoleus sp. A6-C5]|uniref:hypothetical protein n=1 Tax=Microcoleus sp. A6-C5 TaxID=2818547 RepID=UPI002FCF3513